jgi:hypothetical protein
MREADSGPTRRHRRTSRTPAVAHLLCTDALVGGPDARVTRGGAAHYV